MTTQRLPLALLSLAALLSCSPAGRGSMRVIAVMRNAVTAADVHSLTVSVSPSAGGPVLISGSLSAQSGAWSGVFVLAPGTFKVVANAYDASSKLIFTGESDAVAVSENHTTTLAMMLQDANPAPNYQNNPPLITSLVASTDQLFAGATVQLTANVVDLDSDTLSWSWAQSPAQTGVFTSTSGTVAAGAKPTAIADAWTAPTATTDSSVVLTFSVDDGKGSPASLSVGINVSSSTGIGDAQITVRFNDPPSIDLLTVGPNQTAINHAVSLGAHATDPNGDVLGYQWSANSDCAGGFSPLSGAGQNVSFTPTAVPPTNGGQCLFTVTVDDGHSGVVTGTTYLQVTAGGPPTPFFAPTITGTSQQTARDFDGSPVALSVTATSNNGLALSFDWAVVGGTFVAGSGAAGSSSIVWTPPGCDGLAHAATVTVSDGSTLSTTATFAVATCAVSCQEEKQILPASQNGFYLIDADGPGGAAPVRTYCDDLGSGSGHDFNPTADTVLPGGVNRFQNINIPAGVTVRIDPSRNNGVLDLRATGDVVIHGVIDVSGGAGGNGPTYPLGAELWVGAGGGDTGNPLGAGAVAPSTPTIAFAQPNTEYDCGPLLATVRAGLGGQKYAGSDGVGYYYCGVGGHGGTNGGGMGGLGGGGGGGGWGGGGGGAFSAPYIGGIGGGPYGGPTSNTLGQGGLSSDPTYAGGNASAGQAFSSGGGGSIGSDAAADLAMLTTFRPGSGGGGGGGLAGAGGGGGGGALRIVSPTTVTIAGTASLRADGGRGGIQTTAGTYYNGSTQARSGGFGGGGSGGAIYLSAPTVNLLGHLSATGGAGGSNAALFGSEAGSGGNGGLGRIRIAAETLNLTGPCLGCRSVGGPSSVPALPGAFDGSANGSGKAFVSPRYPYELFVNAANTHLTNGTEYHLAAGSVNTFASLTIDPGYSLIIDPPTDCSDPAQTQMTTLLVGGDLVVAGTLQANGNLCSGTFATFTDSSAATAMGVPAQYSIIPGASGGYGGSGGIVSEDNGRPRCGRQGGVGPDGRNGGRGGLGISTGFCGPRNPCFCSGYGNYGGGGGAGNGSGQALALRVAGTLSGTGTINAKGDDGAPGGTGGGNNPGIQVSGGGGGGGGAGAGGGTVFVFVHGLVGTIDSGTVPVHIDVRGGAGGAGGPGSANYPYYGGIYFEPGYGGSAGASGGPGMVNIAGY